MQTLRNPLTSLAVAAAVLAGPAPLGAQDGLVVTQKSTYDIARIGSGDLTQTVMIRGADRQKTVTEGRIRFLVLSRDAGGTEIVRLDQGQVYRVDDRRRRYQERSLADLRGEIERSQRQAEAAAPDVRDDGDVRFWVESEPLQRTGERRTINGFGTEQVVLKLTVMGENTRTGEKGPVFHVNSDLWIDPTQTHASRVSAAFGQAYAARLGLDPRTSGNPYGRWVHQLYDEIAELEGYPIVVHVAFEAEREAGAQEQQREPAAAGNPVGAALGAALRRARPRREQPAPVNPAATGRPLLFSMSTEVLSISNTAPGEAEFEVPSGYLER